MKPTLNAMLSRSVLIGALPVVIALMLSGVISFSYNRLLKDYRDDVDHTFQVMSAIDNALLQLQDAETGQRGFIITGDETQERRADSYCAEVARRQKPRPPHRDQSQWLTYPGRPNVQ